MRKSPAPVSVNARVYQQLRTAHLERARHHTPATIIYTERSYDFESALGDGLALIQAGTFRVAVTMLRSGFRTLEVNEPLVRMRLVRTLVAVLAARLVGTLRRYPVRVVAHAIENRDPFDVATPMSMRTRVRRLADDWMSRRLTRQLDRLSFGTPAAQDLYLQTRNVELQGVTTSLIPELPAPCTCATPERDATSTVLFVGALDERKGVRPLLAAWPVVQEHLPGAHLRILGKGPLVDEVQAAAERLGGIEVVVDPSRAVIHDALREAQVLTLLSQPRARWREQVGLPIVEGLAHGCTVVTTEQTGLAPWLAEHGHVIVASDADPSTVASAIASAVEMRRRPFDVLAALPAVDGRAEADSWLFAPEGGAA